jgi:CubicO group peptidase (beta-lactamase class C family)
MQLGLTAQTYTKISERTKKIIDSTYNALIKKHKVVGMSLAIVDKGEIVYTAGYGFSDREKKVPATDKTIYRIGSCTKSFTSLSLMQLQERGLLDINSSVKKYLPELTITSRFNDNNMFSLRDMMSHVSGLPCDIMNGFFCDAPPSISWEIQELNKQTTISPRRYKQAYSNVAYGLLGEVISRQGKTTYSNYVKENVFKPLEMTSSYIDVDDKLAGGFSKAYVNGKLIKEPLIRDQAAGLIHSNVLDMSNYLLMYLNKGNFKNARVVSPETIKDMERNQIEDLYLGSMENWGYGLYSEKAMCKKDKDSSVVTITGHGGDTYAFHADFGFINDLNVGVVVLTNTDNGTRVNSAANLLKTYLKAAEGKTLNLSYKEPKDTTAPKKVEVNCSLRERKGVYNMGEFVIKVTNTKKIKFHQGPAKIVLKQKRGDTVNYSVSAWLFGIIPFKVKNQEIKFAKRDGIIYAKVFFKKRAVEDYIGLQSPAVAIDNSWKKAYGNYKAINNVYPCKDCPYMNPEGLQLKLMVKKGLLAITTKAKSPDMAGTTYLEIISPQLAVTGGIGRGTGETVRLLENGNIYYSGFEFKRAD